jgi:hypothetical protein
VWPESAGKRPNSRYQVLVFVSYSRFKRAAPPRLAVAAGTAQERLFFLFFFYFASKYSKLFDEEVSIANPLIPQQRIDYRCEDGKKLAS